MSTPGSSTVCVMLSFRSSHFTGPYQASAAQAIHTKTSNAIARWKSCLKTNAKRKYAVSHVIARPNHTCRNTTRAPMPTIIIVVEYWASNASTPPTSTRDASDAVRLERTVNLRLRTLAFRSRVMSRMSSSSVTDIVFAFIFALKISWRPYQFTEAKKLLIAKMSSVKRRTQLKNSSHCCFVRFISMTIDPNG